MSRISKTLAAALSICLWTVPAMASDVEAELAEMRRLVEGLQDKVDAQEEQLDQQGRNLEEAQAVVRRTQEETEAVSGLSSFLNSLEVNGHIAASYAYNVNQPNAGGAGPAVNPAGGGLNQGVSGGFLPFHGDHDNFHVDQVWFGLGKPATEESRAGFRFDILYGNTASFLGNGSPTGGRAAGDGTNDYYISQAYIEYLAPMGDGVKFTGGKFETLTGAEVADTTQNFNITRGNLYNLLQPIDHVGVLVSTDVGPLNMTIGGANSQALGVGNPDDNEEKSLIFQTGMGDDSLSGTATVIWGAETLPAGAGGNANNDDLGIFDFVLMANPSDELSLWLNADYVWTNGGTINGHAWGIAGAGRLAINEKTGFSVRAEYVADNSGALMITQGNKPGAGPKDDNQVFSLTGTLDYTLVEDLMLRFESRYDRVNAGGEFFTNNGAVGVNNLDRDQWVLLAEAIYTF